MQNNIGEARRSYGLTCKEGKFSQEDAAAYFGVSVSTYQKWEQGAGKTLNLETLCEIADLYGTSVDYLLCKTDNPKFEPIRNLGEYEQERELLDLFRKMGESDRAVLLDTARRFAAFSGARERDRGQVAGGVVI